jgi:actin-like ATPase involved in cell morphogenesis
MAITKKPPRYQKEITDTIISRGGTSPYSNFNDDTKENIKITIRLSKKALSLIDKYLSTSLNNKTRNAWINEAIEDKIKKDITITDL